MLRFMENNMDIRDKYLLRLQELNKALKVSQFFRRHEVCCVRKTVHGRGDFHRVYFGSVFLIMQCTPFEIISHMSVYMHQYARMCVNQTTSTFLAASGWMSTHECL